MQSQPSTGSYMLHSGALSVTVLPAEGGRIASLMSLATGLEFLTQSLRAGEYPAASLSTAFQAGPCAGVEECLPTVAPCDASTEGGPAPDHGDFWQLPWQVLFHSPAKLVMQAKGFSRTLLFRKTLQLQGAALQVSYVIQNDGDELQTFLYACHPLFAVDAGDHIVLPEGTSSLRLEYSRNDRLGRRGDVLPWPSAHAEPDMNRASDVTSGTADMLYTGRVKRGECSLMRTATGETLHMHFTADSLPYLGVWLCYGGWPDDATIAKQYAVALEPTTAPYNSLAEAQRAGAAVMLQPGQTYTAEITFVLKPICSRRSGISASRR